MRLEYGELVRPIPLLWWHKRAGFGVKNIRRKQLAQADDVASQLCEAYCDGMMRELARADEGGGERIITSWFATFTCVEEHHRRLVGELLREKLRPDQAKRYLNNRADAWDLMSWNLLWKWFRHVYQVAGLRPVSVDEGDAVIAKDPGRMALTCADVALVMLQRGDDAMAATVMLGTVMKQYAWDEPPPWNL